MRQLHHESDRRRIEGEEGRTYVSLWTDSPPAVAVLRNRDVPTRVVSSPGFEVCMRLRFEVKSLCFVVVDGESIHGHNADEDENQTTEEETEDDQANARAHPSTIVGHSDDELLTGAWTPCKASCASPIS